MKKRFKAAALLIAAAMVLSLLSGCAVSSYDIYIYNDGAVSFCEASYISESYFEANGTTGKEYFADHVAAGQEFVEFVYDGEYYYGVKPEPREFNSIPEFIEYINGKDKFSAVAAYSGSVPYIEIKVDMKSKADLVEEYGGSDAAKTWVDKALYYLYIRFPDGCMTADFPLYGRGVRIGEDDGYEIIAKHGDKAYTFMVSGRLAEGTPVYGLDRISVQMDTPIMGKTPEDIETSVTGLSSGNRSRVDLSKDIQIDWFCSETQSSDPADWTYIGYQEPFEGGKYYLADVSIFFDDSKYTVCSSTEGSFNGEPHDETFGEFNRGYWAYLSHCFYVTPAVNTRPSTGGTVARPSEGGGTNSRPSVEGSGTNSRPSTGGTVVRPSESGGTNSRPSVEGGGTNSRPSSGSGTVVRPTESELTTPFTDVSKDDYYYDAVVWAYNAEPQVTDGNGKDKFMPDQTCTRGQVVTFLYRALKYPLIYSGNNPFKDVNTFNYFYKPVLWAYSTPNRVTDGTSATTFSPDKECTNVQILTFVWRAMGRPDDKGSESTADYWKDAYDWAESKGMLKDTGICLSNINEPCPRKNVVQLLYLYNSMK